MNGVLSFENVTVRYGARLALNDVAVSLPRGHVMGLVGPNGAGKTTLLRAALGFLKPETGSIRLSGKPLSEWSAEARARMIAYLPQNAEAHWPLLARRVVALGRMPHRAAFAPLTPADETAIGEALARCDASAFADRRMDAISTGERARVLLARALATEASVLLADEPAAHLDPAHQLHLMELLRDEARRGTAVAVTLHDLSLAARFCDEVILLREGHVAASGTPDAALSDAALAQVFGVRALRADAGGNLLAWERL